MFPGHEVLILLKKKKHDKPGMIDMGKTLRLKTNNKNHQTKQQLIISIIARSHKVNLVKN